MFGPAGWRPREPGSPRPASIVTAMLIKKAPDLRWSDVTPRELHVNRREFLRAAGGIALAAGVAGTGVLGPRLVEAQVQGHGPKLPNVTKGPFATDEALTPYEDVTTYNNFYEFGI